MTHPAMLTSSAAVRQFIEGGKATFTLVSRKTGARYTYKVQRPAVQQTDRPCLFAKVLTGPSNESDYQYLGMIDDLALRRTKASRIGMDAPSYKALDWLLRSLDRGLLPASVEFWHEGRCCCCGRKLTTPESIRRGVGPECAEKRGFVDMGEETVTEGEDAYYRTVRALAHPDADERDEGDERHEPVALPSWAL